MALADSDLLGFWELEAMYLENEDGTREWPMGEDAEGFILYGPDGHMCAMLQEAGRRLPGDPVPDEDAAGAWRSLFSYSARWTLEGDKVRHAVVHSHDPRLVGTTFERTVRHEGDRMVFSGRHPYARAGQTGYVRWRRPA